MSGDDPQVAAVAGLIAEASPDILVLTGFDFDMGGHALAAMARVIADAGTGYAHRFARLPNTGMATGRDLDGDGRHGHPRTMPRGSGAFAGTGGHGAALAAAP
jgi:hypothetical protein